MKSGLKLEIGLMDAFSFLQRVDRELVDGIMASCVREYDGLPLVSLWRFGRAVGDYVVSRFDGKHYDRASVEYAVRVACMYPDKVPGWFFGELAGPDAYKNAMEGLHYGGERRSALRKLIRGFGNMDTFGESLLSNVGMEELVSIADNAVRVGTTAGGDGWKYTFVSVSETGGEQQMPQRPWWK